MVTMIAYFIPVGVVVALVIIAIIVRCMCFSLCHRRKPEDMTQVILYPEEHNRREGNEPYHVHFEGHSANHDRYYSQYHRDHTPTGEPQFVTAALAGSAATSASGPYVGAVVCGTSQPGTGDARGATDAREPVIYGEAVYVSRADGAASPVAQPHVARRASPSA
ncbi:hypothetical protein ABL78_7606 [Leptomonas seymouri]|uniref:Uncharacterized protein n=1 Tax=Leptomonas seymouri TaxID=5684 RepID=A0A0N1I1Q2_LEPSE|nr:hypothetical protein ABL78_7606 [Leptomonas seymouri]|eukprot:KPI83358.1 hypothetical protein ABL78_7606 [Leptomonas seymouri]